MSAIVDGLEAFANQFGYPGVFAISALGSLIPFVPVPYLVVVVLLSGSKDPLLLGLAAGAGGALGKLTSYFLGRFGYLVATSGAKRNLDALHNVLSRYGALGVFIFAVTPLPDDVYVIPMGIIRLPFWRFFLANLAGKIVLSVGVAYLGRAYLSSLQFLMGDSITVTLIAVAVTVILSLLMMRADWELAIRTAKKGGLRATVIALPEILQLRKKPGGEPRDS